MEEKKDLLKELVNEWAIYTDSDRPMTINGFSEWLNEKHNKPRDWVLPKSIEQEVEKESLDNTVARHFGMLIQLSNVWTKIAFKGMPFQGFEDYGIAQFIMQVGSPTKSNVTEWSTLERSTAFQVIQRMQKLGLIEEFPDPDDKRTKRVRISQKGKAAMKKADKKVSQISKLIVGNLTEKKKVELLKVLHALTKFHLKEYEKGKEAVERNWFSGG